MTTVSNITTSMIKMISRLLMLSTSSLPSPLMAKTFSITTAPTSSAVRFNPSTVTTGTAALRAP